MNILNLDDDALLAIISKVRSADLENVWSTCKRLHVLCQKSLAEKTILVALTFSSGNIFSIRLHVTNSWKLSHDVILRFRRRLSQLQKGIVSLAIKRKGITYKFKVVNKWLFETKTDDLINHTRGRMEIDRIGVILTIPNRMKQLMCPRRLIHNPDYPWKFYYDENLAMWWVRHERGFHPKVRDIAKLGTRISILSNLNAIHVKKIEELVAQARKIIQEAVPLNWMKLLYNHCYSWEDLTDADYKHFALHYSGANNDIEWCKYPKPRIRIDL